MLDETQVARASALLEQRSPLYQFAQTILSTRHEQVRLVRLGVKPPTDFDGVTHSVCVGTVNTPPAAVNIEVTTEFLYELVVAAIQQIDQQLELLGVRPSHTVTFSVLPTFPLRMSSL